MDYPVELNFKKIALAQQATLTDAGGNSIAYARQTFWKMNPALEIFEDKTKAKRICTIKANKFFNFSATYYFYTENEQSFGSIQRKGIRSLWKATYLLNEASGNQYATIKEEKPLGLGRTSYILKREDGTELLRLTKGPSFQGALFKIDKLTELTSDNEIRCMMSLLMVCFLERGRG